MLSHTFHTFPWRPLMAPKSLGARSGKYQLGTWLDWRWYCCFDFVQRLRECSVGLFARIGKLKCRFHRTSLSNWGTFDLGKDTRCFQFCTWQTLAFWSLGACTRAWICVWGTFRVGHSKSASCTGSCSSRALGNSRTRSPAITGWKSDQWYSNLPFAMHTPFHTKGVLYRLSLVTSSMISRGWGRHAPFPAFRQLFRWFQRLCPPSFDCCDRRRTGKKSSPSHPVTTKCTSLRI